MAGESETEANQPRQSPIKGILWMAIAAVFFSISVGLVRQLSETIDAFEQTLWRQVIGTIILLPYAWKLGLKGMKTRQLGTNLIRNTAGYIGISFSFLSITLIPMADTVALQLTLPLFTLVFAKFSEF